MRDFISMVRKMEPKQWLALTATLVFLWSLMVPFHDLLWSSQRYQLGSEVRALLGPDDVDYASMLRLENGVYKFNPEARTETPPATDPSVSMGREGGAPEASIPAYDLDTDPKKGVTVFDPASKLGFKLVPEFSAMKGQQVDNHVVYPLHGFNGQVVYSPKANGLKEDIILHEEQGDELSFSYDLALPDSLEARLESNGSIGIYSGDPTLFGNISFGSEADQAKIELARKNSAKNNIVFTIPAPIIKQSNNSLPDGTTARFTLEQNKVTVHTKGLQKLTYPISIDPTVVVNSASGFTDGNNEGNIQLDSGNNQIKRGALTGGSLGSWASTSGFTTARSKAGAVAYNGFVYVVGGNSGGGTALGDVQYAPINSNGSLGSWSSTTSITTARFAHGLIAYNGYLYAIGGATAAATATNSVQFAKINSNGSVGSWSSTTMMPGALYSLSAAVSNGFIYITGGYKNSAVDEVHVAPVKADGTIGAWVSQTGFSTARYGHQSAIYNNYLYVYGGNGGGSRSDVQYAPINSDGTIGSWVTNSNSLLTARHAFTGGIYAGYMYAVGGEGSGGGYLNTVEYAPLNNNGSVGTFSTTSTLAGNTEGAASVFYNGYAYTLGGSVAQIFSFTGSGQTYTVPAGTTAVTIEAWGARGGASYSLGTLGGLGGYSKGTLNVNPGDVLNVYVGGAGSTPSTTAGCLGTTNFGGGGFNGGGNGAGMQRAGGGGGGASDVRVGGTGLANRVIVAGGGGGGGNGWDSAGYTGGTGGGTTGGTGGNGGGGGGSQGAGGSSGGVSGNGGNGGTDGCNSGGGGGGGGYYGGGGGAGGQWGYGGGGGSGYIGGVSGGTMSNGVHASNGQVTISSFSGSQYAKIDGPGTVGSFSSTTAFTTGRYGHSTVAYNGFLYVVAGFDGTYRTDVQYAPINANGTVGSWSTTTAIPAGRYEQSVVAYNGYMYVLGGHDGSSIVATAYHAPINANGTIGSWTTTTALPSGRYFATAETYKGYIYVTGGYSGASLNTVFYAPINANGTIGTWNTTTNLPSIRHAHTTAVYGGYMYVLAGASGGSGVNTVHFAPINSNGTLGSFSQTSSINTQRWSHESFVHNGYIYVAGGAEANAAIYSDIQYAKINNDGTLGAWAATNNLPTVRQSFSSAVYNGNLYVLGGTNGSSSVTAVNYAAINNGGSGVTGSWASGGNSFSNARYAQASVALNGYIYMMGGYYSATVSPTFSYTGGSQSLVVPAGVTSVTIEAWGAQGGNSSYNGLNAGALGGYARGTVAVTPGTSLNIYVGGKPDSSGGNPAGGYNGGGAGYSGGVYTGGGGGGSDVRIGGTALADRVVIGGGGGGASSTGYDGGTGGGTVGGNAAIACGGTAFGGTQSAGGTGGAGAGTLGQGGNSAGGGGGGGGGYYGGAGGGTAGGCSGTGGGAGGSGYVSGTNTTMSSGVRSGHGQVIISYTSVSIYNDVQYAAINANGSIGSWTTGTAALWPARYGHRAVAANGYLYVVGGHNGTNYLSDVWYAKQGSNGALAADAGCSAQWCSATALPSVRALSGVAVYNDNLYVLGGYGSGALSDVQYASLNASTGAIGSWTSTTAMPAGRNSGAALAYNGYLYMTGGHDGTNYLNSVIYAPINSNGTIGSWSAAASFNVPRYTHALVAYNGYMYLYGGASASPILNDVQYAAINANGTLGNWQHTTSFTTTRAYLSSVMHNGYVYAVGGCAVSGCGTSQTDTQYAPMQSIPRKARYSKLIDVGTIVSPTKVRTSRSGTVTASYRYADTGTAVFGSAIAVTAATGVSSNAANGYTRYIWLQLTMDDSSRAVYGDDSQTAVSGFELYYNPVSTASQQPRLRGGKILQETGSGLTGLNAQPN